MTLADLMDQLDALDDDLTIYAEKDAGWSRGSRAVALPEPDEGGVPDEARGVSYLLEVSVAKEVVEVWSEWRGGRQPTLEDMCEAVIHYAEYDTYLPL